MATKKGDSTSETAAVTTTRSDGDAPGKTVSLRANMLAIVAIIGSAAACFQSYMAIRSLNNQLIVHNDELVKAREEDRKSQVISWQKVIVFNIIEHSFVSSGSIKGVTFNEIKGRYLDEAQTVEGIDLKKKELRDITLKGILLDLMASNLIYQVYPEQRYAIYQSMLNPRFTKIFPEEQAKREILKLLATEGGRWTAMEIGNKIENKGNLSNEEMLNVISVMASSNLIRIDKNNKVHSSLSPPESQ